MPTYEYHCAACGSRYEKRESFSAPARQPCPACGKTAARVLHAPPVVFKGSGFYKTDSRGSSASSDGDGAKPKTEAKPASTEAKPAKGEPAAEASAAG